MMFCFSHALATAICLHTSFASPLVKPDNATMQYGFANVGRTIYMCRYYLNVAVDCESRSCVDALLPEPVSTSCFPPLCFAEVRSTCALLQVPLDYTNVSIGATNIAIIKRPGETPDAQEVLVNPGGPGGSSVDMVLGDCASIQDKIGTKYALVGIDPHKVKNSGPSSDCFAGYPYITRNAY
jgi:hypothetical protein